jgi:hypothetical protein
MTDNDSVIDLHEAMEAAASTEKAHEVASIITEATATGALGVEERMTYVNALAMAAPGPSWKVTFSLR